MALRGAGFRGLEGFLGIAVRALAALASVRPKKAVMRPVECSPTSCICAPAAAGPSLPGAGAQRHSMTHAGNLVELDQLAALGLGLGAAAVPADRLLHIGCAVQREAVSLGRAGPL